MYTSVAADLGRGGRSEATAGLNQWTPGPGAHDQKDEFHPFQNELRRKGMSFGTGLRTQVKDEGFPGAGTYQPDILTKHKKVISNIEKKNFNRFKMNNAQIQAQGWPGPSSYKV
jgi:hypothetical protein